MVKQNKFEIYIDSIFAFIKNNKNPYLLILKNRNYEIVGFLEAINSRTITDKKAIKDLKKWREANQIYFPSQFRVTIKGTASWSKNQLQDKKDRILFFVKDTNGNRIGHIGLYRFDYVNRTCEIDNVIRGVNLAPGIMTSALDKLIEWTYFELGVKKILLTVFADNKRAIELYKRCGFKPLKFIPLKKEVSGGTVNWVEIKKSKKEKPAREYLIMKHQKKS